MKHIASLFIILIIALNVAAQKDSATTWFQKKEWLNGLQMQPHQSINKETFLQQYRLHKSWWDSAFAYLKEQDLQNLAAGKYVIDGDNVFAFVTDNKTKPYDSTKWESHRNYVDLHYIISGAERIGVASIDKLTITMPYDAAKDLTNYSGDGDNIYEAKAGTFFLFFPHDAHRPLISTNNITTDKKIVIKIRFAE